VYTTRRGEQRWQYTSCGTGGTAIELLTIGQGLDVAAAVKVLASRATDTAAGAAEPTPDGRRGRASLPDRLRRWVERAADVLWAPYREPVRRWLVEERRLPEDLLRHHRVGATAVTPGGVLATRRGGAAGRRSSPAVVLPFRRGAEVARAQLRVIQPESLEGSDVTVPGLRGDGSSVGLFRPLVRRPDEVIVTAGVLGALSANAAGYRAAAVVSPAHADVVAAATLARIDGRLVVAFGADASGVAAAHRLSSLLAAQGRPPGRLTVPHADLNDWLVASSNLERKLAAHVGEAVGRASLGGAPGIA
jgi:hypothetical protein